MEFVDLPTGKPHISFSEIKGWTECSYRHYLSAIKKIDVDKPGIHMDFGTAIHSACENFLKTKEMNTDIFINSLNELWELHKDLNVEQYTDDAKTTFIKEGLSILGDVPEWFDKQFPGWEFVDAEHYLYEEIIGHPHAFKGFIDCVIKAPGPRNKQLFWLIDFKTCGFGWTREKKQDKMTQLQLVYYKNYWALKTKTDPSLVRCGFALLKRTAKPGAHCELIVTSVGDLTTKRSLKIIDNMIVSVKRGMKLKNRNSCKWCQYKDTEHCP
jgi:hypothetical protein